MYIDIYEIPRRNNRKNRDYEMTSRTYDPRRTNNIISWYYIAITSFSNAKFMYQILSRENKTKSYLRDTNSTTDQVKGSIMNRTKDINFVILTTLQEVITRK